MAVVEVSITPLGTGEAGVSKYVARCVQAARDSGLTFQLTPMGTILEGELDRVLEVIRMMHEIPFSMGALRVSTLIKIDDRRDRQSHSMVEKMRSVESRLGE